MSEEIDREKEEFIVKKIPISKIEMGRFQARTRKVEEKLDELAENIRILGLINPITVFKKSDQSFELISGQRRFLAINEILKWKEIPARILKNEPSEIQAKALSLSENIMRQGLADSDRNDSVMLLYTRCGASGIAISKTLGIPYAIVLKVIKYEGLSDPLKEEVDKGAIKIDLAQRATEASIQSDGTVDEEKAVKMATIMKTLMPDQQKTMIKISKEQPEATVEQLSEVAKQIPKTKPLRIIMLSNEYSALSEYAKSEEVDESVAAVRAIMKTLSDLGYSGE